MCKIESRKQELRKYIQNALNIRAKKLSNLNPNIRDSRKKIRIRIESKYIRSSLFCITAMCKQGKAVLLNLNWTINTLIIFLSKAKG